VCRLRRRQREETDLETTEVLCGVDEDVGVGVGVVVE